jgi:hypothetical protein
MDDVREKLAHCFALAFPQMDPGRYFEARAENTKEWDSVAQVTLLTLIGEEFGIDVDFEEFEGATSFEAIANRISEISTGA